MKALFNYYIFISMRKIRFILLLAGLGLFITFSSSDAYANHSWGGYHWARTSNPVTLKLGDNLSPSWDSFLSTTSSDWSQSSVLDTSVVTGLTNPKNCRSVSGRVEVCNSKYGNNGWLGIAQIWLSSDHITQGVTKVNDTYFNKTKYNTPAWRNMVMCQEVGHTFGLDHQDEIFNNTNLGTCMDYTDDPSGLVKNQLNNEHPNAHDYDKLATIYTHLDSFITIQSGTQKLPLGLSISQGVLNKDFENRSDWGQEIRNNGHVAVYERDLGYGNKLITF